MRCRLLFASQVARFQARNLNITKSMSIITWLFWRMANPRLPLIWASATDTPKKVNRAILTMALARHKYNHADGLSSFAKKKR
jgi:hypothetical protein